MPLFRAITPVRWVYGDHCVWVTDSAGALVEDDEADEDAVGAGTSAAAVANALVAAGRIVGSARMRDCISDGSARETEVEGIKGSA